MNLIEDFLEKLKLKREKGKIMPKFKCTFKVTVTEERTYIITNYDADVLDEDCSDPDGFISDQEMVEEACSDEICEAISTGDLIPEDEGIKAGETDYNNSPPEFITTPVKVK